MSYLVRMNDEGAVITYPLEMPMHEGNNNELGQQALRSLTSGLRHLAVCEYIETIAPDDDWALQEDCDDHFNQSVDQLISCLMSTIGMLDNMGVDIMQRIMETL